MLMKDLALSLLTIVGTIAVVGFGLYYTYKKSKNTKNPVNEED